MLEDRYLTDEQIRQKLANNMREAKEYTSHEAMRIVARIASDHTLKVIVEYIKEHRVAGYTLCDTVGKCIVIPYTDWQALKELVK